MYTGPYQFFPPRLSEDIVFVTGSVGRIVSVLTASVNDTGRAIFKTISSRLIFPTISGFDLSVSHLNDSCLKVKMKIGDLRGLLGDFSKLSHGFSVSEPCGNDELCFLGGYSGLATVAAVAAVAFSSSIELRRFVMNTPASRIQLSCCLTVTGKPGRRLLIPRNRKIEAMTSFQCISKACVIPLIQRNKEENFPSTSITKKDNSRT